jgi:adenosine deaminase
MLPPVALTGNFSREEMAQLMVNGFEGAWLPPERKADYIAEVRSYLDVALAQR